SEVLWKWIDAHEKELGIGRPYLDKDPPHVGPIDGKEYADKRGRTAVQKAGLPTNRTQEAGLEKKKRRVKNVSAPRHRPQPAQYKNRSLFEVNAGPRPLLTAIFQARVSSRRRLAWKLCAVQGSSCWYGRFAAWSTHQARVIPDAHSAVGADDSLPEALDRRLSFGTM